MSYFTESPRFNCEECGKPRCSDPICPACEWKARTATGCRNCGGLVIKGATRCSRCVDDEDLDVLIAQHPDLPPALAVMRQRLSDELMFSGGQQDCRGGDL